MQKEIFDQWNEKKKQTDSSENCPHFSIGEIWWAQIGQNISTEVAGKGTDFLRPVIIFQKVYGNACMAIPLTSKERKGDYYFSFPDSRNIQQCALLTQIRYLDGKRLKYKQSNINSDDFEKLRGAFQKILTKTPPDGRGPFSGQTSGEIVPQITTKNQPCE
jgi:mRNA interferase MazF